MKIESAVTDNVSDILHKIIEFTDRRAEVLSDNIRRMHEDGFVPMDLPVEEFSQLMNDALCEHVLNKRLLLKDSENVVFGPDGKFTVNKIADRFARELLEEDEDAYIDGQVEKMLENNINRKVAAQLLRQKEGVTV